MKIPIVPNTAPYSKLIGYLFFVRDTLHICHGRAKGLGSYALHTALGSLYEDFQSGTDNILEMTQGYTGILDYDIPASKWMEPKFFLKSTRELMYQYHDLLVWPDVKNEYEGLLGKLSSTIYKIENLS